MPGRRVLRKILLVAVILVLLVAAAVTALFFVDFDSPRLGKALLAALGERAGIEIEAARFRLNLRKGLQLEEVRFATPSPAGRLLVTAERLVCEHRLRPLLAGRFEIVRLDLQRPRIELIAPIAPIEEGGTPPAGGMGGPVATSSGDTAPAAPDAVPAAEEGGVDLRIDTIALADAVLATRTEGAPAPDVEIRGLDLVLRGLALDRAVASPVQAVRAEGDFTAREIALGPLLGTGGHGRLTLGEGHLVFGELGAAFAQGALLLQELDVDLNADPLAYRFTARLDPIQAAEVLGPGIGAGLGAGRLTLEARGSGTETGGLIATGALEMAAGTVPGSPFFKGIELALGRQALQGSAYQPFTARFRLEHDRLTLEPFELRTATVALGLAGWADLAGPLGLRVAVHLPSELVQLAGVSEQVLELASEGGRVTVPLVVGGTVDAPKVGLDRAALAETGRRAARRAVRAEVEKGVGRALRKLFN
jgi:hypothetical protein